MMKYLHITTLCGLLINSQMIAQVDEAQIIPFQAGAPARAADVNQNIQTLITAINNNNAEIKLLREQLALVPSKINLPQPTQQQNLAGSIYHVGILEAAHGTSTTLNGEQRTRLMRHMLFGETGTLTLNTDNTVTLTLAGKQSEADLTLLSGVPAADPTNESPSYGSISQAEFVENETLTGTWSLAGSVLTLVLDGDTETFSVSVDGNTLFNNGADTDTDDPNITMHSVSMDVGVRISKPQPNIYVFFKRSDGVEMPLLNDGTKYILNSGGTSTFKIHMRNTGTSDLIVGSQAVIRTSGNNDLVMTSSNRVLAPGEDQWVLVTDNVSGGLDSEASVYLMSNDTDTPTYIVNVNSNF